MKPIICIITSFISSFIFVLLISLNYFGALNFFELADFLLIWGIFILPVFLINGFIAVYLVSCVQKLFKSKTYFISMIVFILLGIICNIYALSHFIRNGWDDGVIEYLILGISGSLLYFHIWLLLEKITIKRRINLL
ncbi:hypothetical protein [Sporosarcina sp. JAI121]|uniref:hypothetical protein n=1 Tax=Sporosarcina sp. JAI121 TaxID=2723064 RepID=UPI0015C7096E|nr:hypothetical protein [Sporosarcina sp. JAI121]NYF23670.1 hypothetical protein [Sporosarcina sp. JAI121]